MGDCRSKIWGMLDQLEPATISLVIVEDDRRIREGLRVLLDGTPGFRCVNAWRSLEEALAEHWSQLPAVALIDLGLPGISGIEALGWLRERHPTVAFVVLTVFDDDEGSSMRYAPALVDTCSKERRLRGRWKVSAKWLRAGRRCHPKSHAEWGLFRAVRPREQVDCNLTPHELRM